MKPTLPILAAAIMVAVFLAAMIAIKLVIAPWIVASFGAIGVATWLIACLAIGKWLED